MTSEVDQLEQEVLRRAAAVHAATAALADAVAAFDAARAWEGWGIRSIGHWADINLGIGSRRANQLAHAASRLAELPALRAAFAEGSVSLDKVLLVAPVATSASDGHFTAVARAGTVAQVQRICVEYRKLGVDESPDALARRHERRHLSVRSTDEGLVRLVALLEPDEAALVLAALDARVEEAWRRQRTGEGDGPAPELSVRRVDALVELATEGLVAGSAPVVRGERVEVRVHVDAEVLAGSRPDGVATLEGVGAVSLPTIQRLLCDSKVCLAVRDRDGVLNLGRSQRTVSRRQRRALRHRDKGCRFPGCSMQRFVDGHHVQPWEHDGPTDMDNLLLLCPFHHRLFHEGGYGIDALGDGQFTFRRPDGRAIGPPPLRAEPGGAPPPAGDPRAEGGGERFDLALTIDALLSG